MIKVPNVKAITFNCKGLTNSIRAKAIHIWLKDSKIKFDFICLNEIKTFGFNIKANLTTINR